MIRTALKGVIAHRLRLAMTALAVVIGVALVSGTYVFTDTINARFDSLFADVYAGVDATVRPEPPSFGEETGSMPRSVLDDVQATDGVSVAVGTADGVAQMIARDGQPIGGQGPPTLGVSWVDVPALAAVRIEDGNGRAPTASGEVAIDAASAEGHQFEIGDEIDIQVASGVRTFEIVGIANFGTEDNLAGATLSIFELSEAQELFGLQGRYTAIDVLADSDIDETALVQRLSSVVPDGLEVVSGDQQAQESISQVNEGLGFLNTALLAFAGIALFVGTFIIQNTFRIIVAQRTRELAMLRAIGATGRQVVQLVTVEASAVALAASAVGVGVGVGLSGLLNLGMNALGFNIPDGPLTVQVRTVLVGMGVGLVVTLVAALLPARRAASVPPVAAMSDSGGLAAATSLRTRAWSGAALMLAGAGAVATGLLFENGASVTFVAAGAVLGFLGVSVMSPMLAAPIGRLLGRPLPGVTGRLARDNTIRHPRRTASTAAALMVGVALVVFVSIFAASIKASVSDTLNDAFPADLAFQSTNTSAGVSSEVAERLSQLDEVETVSSLQSGAVRVEGEVRQLVAVEPETISEVYSMDATIDLAELGDGMLVHASVLEQSGWQVGDRITVEYPSGGLRGTVVSGTFSDSTFAGLIVTDQTYDAYFASDEALIVFARLAEGVALEDGEIAAQQVLEAFPAIDMNTAAEQAADAEAAVDQLVTLFYGLLGLAVLIAVLGIANTLALSVVERFREIGLLRAIGMVRRQVRQMIRWESVIIALFGGLLGVAVGSALGWVVVASLGDQGLGTVVLPIGQLGMWLGLAAVAGVLAAIVPARSASRLDVLTAISYE